MAGTLAEFFELDEHDTDVSTEILAGVTTFLTMSYIVVVNPAILSAAISVDGRTTGQTIQMLAVVTIISAATATLVMALYANRPFAQAPGLGLNAFFAFTVVLGLGVPWQTALAAVVVEGVVFIALTAVGAREYIIKLFPEPVKFAVGAGIGLFLAIIGLEAMHVVASDPATFLQFNPVFASDPIAIISVLGLFVTFALYSADIPGSIVIGIALTTLASYAAAALGYSAIDPSVPALDGVFLYTPASLTGQTDVVYSAAGYDITPLVGAFLSGFSNVDALGFSLIVFTFFFVDFFDTAGTLTGVSQIAGFLDEEGNLPDIDKPLMADAVGTTVGGIIGTSTVTTYIESATGVEEGGRTGLTALVVALLFLASLALVPLAAAVPLHASHIALVVIAVLMLRNIVDIRWNDLSHAVPAGLTMFIMPFTYSISYGIAAGIIAYPVVKAAQGDYRDVHAGQWVLAAAFVFYFFVRTSGILAGAL
ncbi:NCS2 family permease [Halomicroarcula limicola]|uniref:NCS2 family permease n=1 Tax=Haloarcula limicola TaxID=1429915 RepID=A0A8J7Y6Z8_9EURY|nr:NCS2 family permease [Halomicroarcula limicola]MBV0925745.1 NCS2 family permease [Halomicroarcula limicola]